MTTVTFNKYYLANQNQLEAQLHDRLAAARAPLLNHYAPQDAFQIEDQTREEFRWLLPQIPYVGGVRNPYTPYLVDTAMILALYRAMKALNVSMAETFEVVYEAARSWLGHQPRGLMRLFGRMHFGNRYLEGLRKRARKSQRREFPGDWVYQFVDGHGQKFDYGLNIVECGVGKFLHAQGADELLPYMCALECPMYRALGVEMTRTAAIGRGDPLCNPRFRRVE